MRIIRTALAETAEPRSEAGDKRGIQSLFDDDIPFFPFLSFAISTMKVPILSLIAVLLASPIAASTTTTPCHPRAWIRAPDLAPGLTTPAHARLSLNGTGCQLVEWTVGLRMTERGIFKFQGARATTSGARSENQHERSENQSSEARIRLSSSEARNQLFRAERESLLEPAEGRARRIERQREGAAGEDDRRECLPSAP
jgi:hypothetical protein